MLSKSRYPSPQSRTTTPYAPSNVDRPLRPDRRGEDRDHLPHRRGLVPSHQGGGVEDLTGRTVKVLTWAKDKRLKAWGQWFQFFVPEGLEGFSLRYFTNVLEVRPSPPFDVVRAFLPIVLIRHVSERSGPTRKRNSISSICERRPMILAFTFHSEV